MTNIVYAKDPTRTNRWVAFEVAEDGSLKRFASYGSSPKKFGFRRIKWPETYNNAPLTEMIKVVSN